MSSCGWCLKIYWKQDWETRLSFHSSSCCSDTKSCLTLCDPMDCSTPGFPVLHYLLEFVQTHTLHFLASLLPSFPWLFLLNCFTLSLCLEYTSLTFLHGLLFDIILVSMPVSPYQGKPFRQCWHPLPAFPYSPLFFFTALFTSDKLCIYLFICIDHFNSLLSGLLASTLALHS